MYENSNAQVPSSVTEKMKKTRIAELNKFLPSVKEIQTEI